MIFIIKKQRKERDGCGGGKQSKMRGREREREKQNRGRGWWGRKMKKKKKGLSSKLGIKPVYTAFRHLENSSGKQGMAQGATYILKNCPHFQQTAICYLLYKSSPVSTTISQGSVYGVLPKSL